MTESGPREGLPLQASQMPRQGRHGLVGLLLEPGLGSTTILRFLPCCLALASVAARPGSRSAELRVPATETASRANATLNPREPHHRPDPEQLRPGRGTGGRRISLQTQDEAPDRGLAHGTRIRPFGRAASGGAGPSSPPDQGPGLRSDRGADAAGRLRKSTVARRTVSWPAQSAPQGSPHPQ